MDYFELNDFAQIANWMNSECKRIEKMYQLTIIKIVYTLQAVMHIYLQFEGVHYLVWILPTEILLSISNSMKNW